MVGADDDGRPVVGEGTAEGVSERMLRREADERGEDGGVDCEQSRWLVLGGRWGEGFEDGVLRWIVVWGDEGRWFESVVNNGRGKLDGGEMGLLDGGIEQRRMY